jgi:hypothetical protein
MIAQLSLDDRGQLWVLRADAEDGGAIYDVFSRDGDHIRTLSLSVFPMPPLRPRIRDGNFHAVVLDELGVPRVMRLRLP